MKIAELAKKLELAPKELREKIIALGFNIGKKARTIKDETALQIEEKIQKEKEFLAQKTPEKPIDQKAKPSLKEKPKAVIIPEVITVKEFASKIKMPITEVIRELVKNGVMASINENIDYETAAIIADDFGYKTKLAKERKEPIFQFEEEAGEMKKRPPVITVIGHIDHGKTTLIDNIRKTNIVGGESGGITQHIGAYQIKVSKGQKKEKVTVLDTPGHEAFVAMREHGTKIADIAILVVAADEGVMPQTKEAINHAKSAGVPIIVAITKIDKPSADIEKVKKQLSEAGLAPEDWGGTTSVLPVSAQTGKGIPELLEIILLAADMEKFQASFSGRASGVVIESHLDPRKGPVSTILMQKGILKVKDAVVTGEVFGKIRLMEDFAGNKIREAKPSEPVRVYGFASVPDYGERVFSFDNDKEAKKYIIDLQKTKTVKGFVAVQPTKVEKETKKLNLIIKADMAGSLKAILDAVKKIKTDQGEIFVVLAAVGGVSESDIMTAEAAGATILAFRVKAAAGAAELALQKKIKILFFQVIYDLTDQVKVLLAELIGPIKVRKEIGQGKVLAIFRKTKTNKIIGVKVTQGKLIIAGEVKVFRGEEQQEVGIGKINSLKVQQEKRQEIESGSECGIGIEADCDIQINDRIVAYQVEEKSAEIK